MDAYAKRKFIIAGFFLGIAAIYILRLFYLQVISNDYKIYATRNSLRPEVIFPARGVIFDRNGELLVQNQAAYDLMMTPREVKYFDTLELCRTLKVEKADLIESINKAKSYSRVKPSIIVKQISPDVYAPFQEKLYRYPGFFVQTRTLRQYPRKIGSHILGYIGEVTPKTIETNKYYKSGDYIGASGLEQSYEDVLRGIKGITYYLVDVHNRKKGKFEEGKMDTAAVLGKNLISTIDVKLQEYAEQLLQNKKGAVVAIEPKTGEVLVCASAPSYDPNLLVGRERNVNYPKLLADTLKPLYNRAITASYPPGSTFKLVNALVALQEGAVTPYTAFSCSGPASTPIKCTHNHASPISMVGGIKESCNPYFWNVFRSIIAKYPNAEAGYTAWRNDVLSFGLNSKLTDELTAQNAGNIPDPSYYDKIHGKGHWNALTVRSLAIGQGEILVTPFQMANVAAIIANHGSYIVPHLVRAVQDIQDGTTELKYEKKECVVSPIHFDVITEGMEKVVAESSTRFKSAVKDVVICGKTGTIQNPSGAAHSAFLAFAPKENPKIAIFTYIENGVWGASAAAPISSLIIEKYLNDSISPARLPIEKQMLEMNLIDPNHHE